MSLESPPACVRTTVAEPALNQRMEETSAHVITVLANFTFNQQQGAGQADGERLFTAAVELCNNHKWEQLIAACDALIAQGLQGEWVMEAKARACHDLGRWEDYLAQCRSLLQSHPEKVEYLKGTIRGCMKTQRYVEAIHYLSRLIATSQTSEIKRWALAKRQEACTLQADADAQAMTLLTPAAADPSVDSRASEINPDVWQHSP